MRRSVRSATARALARALSAMSLGFGQRAFDRLARLALGPQHAGDGRFGRVVDGRVGAFDFTVFWTWTRRHGQASMRPARAA